LLLLDHLRLRSAARELLANLIRVAAAYEWVIVASSAHFEVAFIGLKLLT